MRDAGSTGAVRKRRHIDNNTGCYLLGEAHSHPSGGTAAPSNTDLTSWSHWPRLTFTDHMSLHAIVHPAKPTSDPHTTFDAVTAWTIKGDEIRDANVVFTKARP